MADTPEQLSIVVEQGEQFEHQTIIRLQGELDLATAPAVTEALGHANGDIVIDCTELTFMDASGIQPIARAADRSRSDGDRLIVVNARPLPQRVLAIAGLDDLLSESDAL